MNAVLTYLARNRQRLSLQQCLPASRLSCVLATPRFRSSSHVINFILSEGVPDPILVVKVPRIPGDDDRLIREAANLRTVHAARYGGFDSIPRLVACEEYLGHRLLIETALPGDSMSAALRRRQSESSIEAALAWLIELHQRTTQQSAHVTGWTERLIDEPLEQFMQTMPLRTDELHLIDQTRAITRVLRNRDVPLVFEHGDLGPPNILLSKRGGLGVVDWELAQPSGLPAVDLFFLLTLIGFARRRASSPAECVAAFHQTFFGESPWARPYIDRYAHRMQLGPELLTPLFVLCWGRYVAGLISRLHDLGDAAGTVESETTEWLRSNRYYALWYHAIQHVDKLNLAA